MSSHREAPNDGDAQPNITYQFNFTTQPRNPNTFLYTTGQIGSLDDPNWNKRQFYDTTKTTTPGIRPFPTAIGSQLASPPCNIGPRSTPNYAALAQAAVHTLPTGKTVFAGQRNDGFFVDLGAIFDLGDLRPFQNLHLIPSAAAASVDPLATLNVHTIAMQIPIKNLTQDGRAPTDAMSSKSVPGIWGAASRQAVQIIDGSTTARRGIGPWTQVSRLGNPLFNEVIVPLGKKDQWNSTPPSSDSVFAPYVRQPDLSLATQSVRGAVNRCFEFVDAHDGRPRSPGVA